MDASQWGRWLVVVGLGIAVVGGLVWALARINLQLGRLPGDLTFGGDGFRISIPLASSIVISIILTIVLNLAARLWNR